MIPASWSWWTSGSWSGLTAERHQRTLCHCPVQCWSAAECLQQSQLPIAQRGWVAELRPGMETDQCVKMVLLHQPLRCSRWVAIYRNQQAQSDTHRSLQSGESDVQQPLLQVFCPHTIRMQHNYCCWASSQHVLSIELKQICLKLT